MSDKKAKIPQIRFAGFEGEWEERKFVDEVDLFSGLTYSPNNIVAGNGTLVLRSSNVKNGEIISADNVYVDPSIVNSCNVKEGDVIVVVRNGSRSLIGKHAQIKGDMSNTVIGAFMTGIRSVQPDFINALLNTQAFDIEIEKNLGATINQITNSAFQKMKFMFPNVEEQNRIGEFFTQLDNLITLQQRQFDKLASVKKNMLEKMFPKDGANEPEIRFAGFTGAWEWRKLGELLDITTGKLDANAMVEDGAYDFYTSGIKKYRIDTPAFEGPAITIAGNGATVGYMHLADGKFNAYQRTYVLENFRADRQFLYSEIGKRLPRKIAEEARTGNIPYIVMEMLTNLNVSLPVTEDEQRKIGTFFTNLDNLISLHQRQLNALKTLKQSLLQQLFV